MTIAQYVATEQELERREANHFCPEKALADLMTRQKATASHTARN
jgi:hypothetical protein